MAYVVTYKELGVELGNIAALTEMINNYLSKDKQSKSKSVKQSDRELVKVLKANYSLTSDELEKVLAIVDGKKLNAKKSRLVIPADLDFGALKRDIDSLISSLDITIRDKNLSEENYYKKVKANLSVRKGKIVKQLHAGREKKTK